MMDSSVFFPYPGKESRESRGFLAGLHEDEVQTVLSYTQTRRYAPGDLVIAHGETDRSIYMVTGGEFEVRVPSPRGLRLATTFRPGDIFGELAFFDRLPRSADVRAVAAAEALVMTPMGFDRLRLSEPRLALLFVMDLGRILSARFREYNRRLAVLGEL